MGLGTVSVRRVRRAGLFRGLRRVGVVVRCWRGGGVGKRGLSRGTAGGVGIVDARRGGVRGALGTIAVEVVRIVAFRSRSGGRRVGVRKGFVVAQQVGGHGGTATNEHGDAGCGQQVRGHSTGSTSSTGSRGDAETAGCGSAGGSGAGSSAAGNSGCGLCAGCGGRGHDGGATGDNAQN